MKEIKLLGHIVFEDKILVDLMKIEEVLDQKQSSNISEIRGFLGLVGYCHHFVKGFLKFVSPLTRLAEKGIKFEWSEDYEISFQKLKQFLTLASVLIVLVSGLSYIMFTDVFGVRLGIFLMQESKVVAYALRHLKPHEKNYPIYDLELASIVFTLNIQRYYLLGDAFDVFCNYKSFGLYLLVEKPKLQATQVGGSSKRL